MKDSKLVNLFLKGKFDLLLDEINDLDVPSPIKKRLLVLKKRATDLEKENNLGVLSTEAYLVEKNRINRSFVDLIESIENQDKGVSKRNKIALIGLVFFVIIFAVLSFFRKDCYDGIRAKVYVASFKQQTSEDVFSNNLLADLRKKFRKEDSILIEGVNYYSMVDNNFSETIEAELFNDCCNKGILINGSIDIESENLVCYVNLVNVYARADSSLTNNNYYIFKNPPNLVLNIPRESEFVSTFVYSLFKTFFDSPIIALDNLELLRSYSFAKEDKDLLGILKLYTGINKAKIGDIRSAQVNFDSSGILNKKLVDVANYNFNIAKNIYIDKLSSPSDFEHLDSEGDSLVISLKERYLNTRYDTTKSRKILNDFHDVILDGELSEIENIIENDDFSIFIPELERRLKQIQEVKFWEGRSIPIYGEELVEYINRFKSLTKWPDELEFIQKRDSSEFMGFLNGHVVVKYNDIWWNTENVREKVKGSFCFLGEEKCKVFGRHYNVAGSQNVCKKFGEKWRLPTLDEWAQLFKSHGGYEDPWTETVGNPKKAFESLTSDSSVFRIPNFDMGTLVWNLSGKDFFAKADGVFYWSAEQSGGGMEARLAVFDVNSREVRLSSVAPYNRGNCVRCVLSE